MPAIPFPPQLATQSARNAAASYDSRRGMRPGDHSTDGVACYRLANGEFKMAYDPYRPDHPEGAEPGLGTISCKLEWYPNDTSGYKITVTDFTPAAELLRGSKEWDNPAAAIVTTRGNSIFFIAPSQSHLDEIIHVPAGADFPIKRPHVNLIGLSKGAPEAAVFMNPAGRDTMLLGAPKDIAEHLLSRYDIGTPQGGSERSDLTIDEQLLVQVCAALEERYTFSFKMCEPENLIVMNEAEMESSHPAMLEP